MRIETDDEDDESKPVLRDGQALRVSMLMMDSGTVAAVREATLLGKSGIAFSQYRRRGIQADWQRASRWTALVLELLLPRPLARGRSRAEDRRRDRALAQRCFAASGSPPGASPSPG